MASDGSVPDRAARSVKRKAPLVDALIQKAHPNLEFVFFRLGTS